jgi:general transcription factor 3C polypeptide 5 (transcription factor C subunit 1)
MDEDEDRLRSLDGVGSTSSSPPLSLVAVEYPGVVVSVPKMLETLGGIVNVSRVVSEQNRRLELRFRPNDAFCKPSCGERTTDTTSFLIRVKKKRNKKDPSKTRIESEVVGTVSSTFKFGSLCDFQYLPMTKENNRTEGGESGTKETSTGGPPRYKSIYDDIFIDRLVDSSWLAQNENDTPAPLFLPPAAFSRMDAPQDYQYRREAASDKATANAPYNIIGRTRQRRSHHAVFVTYDVEKVPDRPRDVAVNQLKVKFIGESDQSSVRARFAEQPCWSKNALSATTDVSKERIKFILPATAYYFTTGPWRNQV